MLYVYCKVNIYPNFPYSEINKSFERIALASMFDVNRIVCGNSNQQQQQRQQQKKHQKAIAKRKQPTHNRTKRFYAKWSTEPTHLWYAIHPTSRTSQWRFPSRVIYCMSTNIRCWAFNFQAKHCIGGNGKNSKEHRSSAEHLIHSPSLSLSLFLYSRSFFR